MYNKVVIIFKNGTGLFVKTVHTFNICPFIKQLFK